MMSDSAKLEDAVTGQCEMVQVPRVPTQAMLTAAADAALAEDAAWVWSSMIESYELTTAGAGTQREVGACSLASDTPETDS
jgi:hypothetical protein